TYTNSSVSVLLGKGGGTFQTAVDYDAGGRSRFVAVGDFNGDGKPDLAVVNSIGDNGAAFPASNVAVLLGKGDGSFHAAVNYDAGANPSSAVVGDFNGDGKSDLAVANNGSFPETTVAVLLGNGDGTLQNAISYVAGWIPQSLAVGDFNADGKPDLAVATFENGVSVLFGNGDGNFQAVNHFAGRGTYVTAGDFNGDGKADLLEANGGTVSVLLGKGDGTFQAGLMYS